MRPDRLPSLHPQRPLRPNRAGVSSHGFVKLVLLRDASSNWVTVDRAGGKT